MNFLPVLRLTVLALLILSLPASAIAQRGQPVPPDVLKKMQEAQIKAAQAAAAAKAKAAATKTKSSTNKKPTTAKKTNAKAAKPAVPAVKPVTRSTTPETPPDPNELKARPDADGKVRFNFNGQPWPLVVEWLAEISEMSLDWQELPGGYLNLTTRGSYTVEEARDIINQHLLVRGYTLLREGETLRVTPIKKMNKSLVPRVPPEELEKRMPNEFVRTSFKLDWMVAANAIEEFKPMLSEHGTLTPLNSTNRLEALDTVSHLREIFRVIREEQSGQAQESLVKQFRIKHRRASDVIVLVYRMLGMNPDDPSKPLTSSQVKAIQKAVAAAQKAAKGQVVRVPIPTRLILNERENSILAQAEPDMMERIRQTIEQIDVPVDPSKSMIGNLNRMKVYKLNTFPPKPLVDLLVDLGELDPRTKLKVDENNKSIIAYASLTDHLVIQQLVERVDGSLRHFEVVQLKRLDAAQVAGTIQAMMGGEENSRNSRRRYDDYYYYGYSSRRKQESTDKFRVEADVDNNRLLLRANDGEMQEINTLLTKLGEAPSGSGSSLASHGEMIRVYDAGPAKNAQEVLRQFKKLWQLENPIEIDIPDVPTEDKKPAPAPTTDTRTGVIERASVMQLTSAQRRDIGVPTGQLDGESDKAREVRAFFDRIDSKRAAERVAAEKGDDKATTVSGAAPIRISLRADGRIVLTSNDRLALQVAERLLQELLPPKQDFKIYHLKYCNPSFMALTLEDYFDINSFDSYWDRRDDDKARLSKKKEMKFIYDNYTSTLMVKNADASQLATIEKLIEVYDKPEPSEGRSVRVTKIFKIKNSRAEVIATTVKDVFRDLLSGNDKALQQPGNANDKKGGGRMFFDPFSSYISVGDENGGDGEVKFKGLLSIGVDTHSNTLVVSTTQGLLQTIGEIIDELDAAAAPSSNVRVVKISRNINLKKLEERLNKLLAKPKQPQPTAKKPPGQPQPQPKPGR